MNTVLSPQAIESRTLALTHTLAQQLQTTCLVLVSGLQGLPGHIQQEGRSLRSSASHIYSSFSRATAMGELPDSVLSSCRVQLGRMKDSLDHVMDYLVNNTPLNWLVGPFYPRMSPESPSCSGCPTAPLREEPVEVEMAALPLRAAEPETAS